MSRRDDLHTYRALRRIYCAQRGFWLVNDRMLPLAEDRQRARRERIKQFLGKRRKYAPSLTNGRYDEYGYVFPRRVA